MGVLDYWNNIANAGVNNQQTHTFSDKLQTRNRLSFLCAIFSLVYFVYFLVNGYYLPFIAISIGIAIFLLSIVLNHFEKYTLSSSLILLNTNYCVLFFSIYLGFDSGIHLYLFTSALSTSVFFLCSMILCKHFSKVEMITYENKIFS